MTAIPILAWLVALEALGLMALPLAVRVFRRLDDRGYGLTKPLGFALVGYACWLLGSLGLLNSTQPTVLVLMVLLAIVLWRWNGRETLAVLRGQRGLIAVSELVFLALFGLALVVRAYGAAINGQEKFMDMAIYHAFVRSDQLPAEDPWLAGYAMPYYYLGYFLWALVAKATDVPPAVGYNLALASTLGLLAAGLFGLGYTLVRAQLGGRTPSPNPLPPQVAGASGADYRGSAPPIPFAGGRGVRGFPFAPLAALLAFVGVIATAVMGNLQEAVAMAARSGWGTVQFWQETVGVKNVPPQGPNPFPNEVAWFNAARVIPNVQPDGITEFPWFSLILGDLHPHFVALPYELLTVGLAIAVFRNLLARRDHGKLDIGIAALALGLLIPLNTWDVGTFWVIYALAVIAGLLIGGQAARQAAEGRRVGAGGKATAVGQQAAEGDGVGAGGGGTAAGQQTPSTAADAARAGAPRRGVPGAAIPAFLTAIGESLPPVVLEAAAVLVPTFGLAVLLYVPYFLGYQSQPLGLGFVTERTMVGTLFVLFGPLLVLAVGAIVRGWLDALADPGVRAVLGRNWWAIGAAVIVALAPLPRLVPCCGVRDPTLSLLLLLLVGLLPLVVAAWRGPRGAILAPTGTLLLVCTIGLLLGTELIFLRDSFGTRMNTVFKFYYHVWLLLGLLSPVLVAYLLRGRPNPPAPFPAREGGAPAQASAAPPASSQARGTPTPAQPAPPFPDREGGLGGLGRLAFGALAVLIAGGLMVGGMLYPVGATWTKDNAFKDPATLDGAAWMQASRPGDAEAVRWLQEHMPGRPVIAEAFGDDYSEAARVSTFSGLPTLLGWIGHELQWRGNQNLFEQRTQTLETIYRGAEPALLAGLLQTQHVDYVYVGPLEVEKYGAGVRDRFEGQLEPVYHSNDVTIYRVPQPVTVGVGLADLRP